MHSQLHLPHIGASRPQVPVVPQCVGQHVATGTDLGLANGVSCELMCFDLALGLEVPEGDGAVGAGSHEPLFVAGVEGHAVDGVEVGDASGFRLVALEGDDRLLSNSRTT